MGQGVVLRLGRRVHANADLDSLTPRFAVEAREAIQEHLAALFASLRHSLKTPRKVVGTYRCPNNCQQTPLHLCQPHSPLPSLRHSMRNLPKTMRPGMTGLPRGVSKSGK